MTASPITRLCLVRHGETDWNLAGRLQGQLDIPLNANGLRQAEQLAQALQRRGMRFDGCYCSDLGRARETAAAVARRLELERLSVPALRERHFGCFQGLTYEEARVRMPQLYLRFKAREPDFAPSEGECLSYFYRRVNTFLGDLVVRHPGQTLLIVSHGGVLDMAYRLASGKPLEETRDFPIPNAALNWISHNQNGWRLDSWADQTHLQDSLDEL
ncbi:histidine phosphatase family protein [Paludibacterium yongneupense]|uniref:histidine phosphatase family protein n=1 Tax=Paludibacterium yongneupense TaxID=400061 RepID=UPI00042A89D2|nr:histidine phosphatase family protein [Paludibacterium yongneupense]